MSRQPKAGKPKQNLKQAAYEHIKESILSCQFAPGAFINEYMLCQQLGLSRTPVRDAIGRLEQEGLVTIMPKKGIIVSPLRLVDINRIYEVRQLLEPYALLHYGHKLERKRLQYFLHLMEETDQMKNNSSLFYKIDDDLHNFIIQATGNKYLMEIYGSIINLNRRFRVLTGNEVENRIVDTFREHTLILQACIQEDYQAAAQAMTDHLEASRKSAFLLVTENELANL